MGLVCAICRARNLNGSMCQVPQGVSLMDAWRLTRVHGYNNAWRPTLSCCRSLGLCAQVNCGACAGGALLLALGFGSRCHRDGLEPGRARGPHMQGQRSAMVMAAPVLLRCGWSAISPGQRAAALQRQRAQHAYARQGQQTQHAPAKAPGLGAAAERKGFMVGTCGASGESFHLWRNPPAAAIASARTRAACG